MADLKKLQALSKNYSILYVEDNELLRENAKRLLRKFFHIVCVAQDGEEGLKKFKKTPFPIVITDIKMPNMDGVALTKEIKKIAPQTHVIVMSAFDDKEYLLELIEYGIFKFLKKPIKLNVLTDVLYTTMLKIIEEKSPDNFKEEAKEVEVQKDENLDNVSLLFSILRSLKEKNEKISLHNFYKGLSITNDAKILGVSKNSLRIKTTFVQQKAMQYESKAFIVSESLPYVVECTKAHHESFENHIVALQHLKFIKTSPIKRETIRIVPQEEYTVSLFIQGLAVTGAMRIADMSLHAVRLSLDSLPAGLRDSKDTLEIFLDKGSVEIKSKVSIFRIDETENTFYIVLMFEKAQRTKFMKYITLRQMAIIREFKGMQNG